MKKVYINDSNCITPLGFNREDNWRAIQNSETGISMIAQWGNLSNICASKMEDTALNEAFSNLEMVGDDYTHLDKMLFLALDPLINRHGVKSTTALILSTTKGNIDYLKTDEPIRADLNYLAAKIARYYGFKTLPIIVCNACVSGVMALSVAKRLIQMDQFEDAYIVAGDVLSEFVVSGFSSFQALSNAPCKPYDQNRTGVSLGEATAAVYLSAQREASAFQILGDASVGDANHISGPSRTGEGLYQSIRSAISEAGIDPQSIDMISTHGTATQFNDEMEAIALNRMGLENVPTHSLKGYYGHTLGASGLLEVVMTMEAMKANTLIVCKGFEIGGTSQKLNITTEAINQPINRVLKTASGFGGTNSAVVLEKAN